MTDFDVVSLQRDYWDSPWQNRHAMVSELARQHRVLFLSPPFELGNVLEGRAWDRTRTSGLQRISGTLHAYTPPRWLPTSGRFPRLDRLTRLARRALVRRHMRRLGIARAVAYVWHPAVVDWLDDLNPAAVVYHKYDHYAGYAGGSSEPDPREQRLFREADAVMVTSMGLFDMHRADATNLHFVPNGVDYEAFAGAARDARLPHDLAHIPGPRIGYVGVVNEKVDFKLLAALCDAQPGWSIVLVGPVNVREEPFLTDLANLRRRDNCYMLGPKPHTEVPAYVAGMDVCMMCYLVNAWTYFGYPLKMHEYLAAGKPSIATDLPAIREFAGVVRIANGAKEWEEAIAEALATDSEAAVAERQQVARANSWTERARVVDRIVEDCLRRRAVATPGISGIAAASAATPGPR